MLPFGEGDEGGPAVVGHRGAPLVAAENTPVAFAAAAAAGAGWVELDARRSRDGTVVVHHDACTADGTPVVDQDAGRLRARGVWTLAAVLDRLPPGLGVDVEVKNFPGEPDHDDEHRLAALVADVLRAAAGGRPRLTSSFNPLTVAALAAGMPGVPAGLVHGPGLRLDAAAEIGREFGATVVCPHVDAPALDALTVAAVRAAGMAVMVWPVDDPVRAVELAAVGVDALCTNDPAELVQALRRRR